MMKRLNVKLQRETTEQQLAAGRYNPALGFFYKRLWVSIKSGTGDQVTVWSDHDDNSGVMLYVLSTNARYNYAGLTTYYPDCLDTSPDGRVRWTIEESQDMFIQNATEGVCEDFFDLEPAAQRKLLEEYL